MEKTCGESHAPVTLGHIAHLWWPLALSWLLMGTELPIYSAVIARLEAPTVNLAAFGGIVYPFTILLESPIIMLLAASTALCTSRENYALLRKFMLSLCIGVTALHAAMAFTPLFSLIIDEIVSPPPAVTAPARLGLMLSVVWPFCVGYRRFNQGIMIKYGKSRLVGIGTIIRLGAGVGTALLLAQVPGQEGVFACSIAMSAGVVAEAAFSAYFVRSIVRDQIPEAEAGQEQLSWRALWAFYIPLAMTPFLVIAAQPLISTAMSRMPNPLPSLAAWPVVAGVTFAFRSLGIAFNEVVIALAAPGESARQLARFTRLAGLVVTAIFLLVLLTPLTELLLNRLFALPADLLEMTYSGLWICCLLPALNFYQSWYQGALLSRKFTLPIIESVAVFLGTAGAVLAWGVYSADEVGLYYAAEAYSLATAFRTLWLQFRSGSVRAALRSGDPTRPAAH